MISVSLQHKSLEGFVRFFTFLVDLAHTHPSGSNWFSIQDRDLAHGLFDIGHSASILGWSWFEGLGDVPIPRLNVHMGVIVNGSLEVRRFDNTMDRRAAAYARGRRIF